MLPFALAGAVLILVLLMLDGRQNSALTFARTSTPLATNTNRPSATASPSHTPRPPARTATTSPTPTPVPVVEVLVQTLKVREGPGPSYPSVALVRLHEELTVLGAARGVSWVYVVLPSGTRGWISSSPDRSSLSVSPDSLPSAFFRPPSSMIQSFPEPWGAGCLRIENGTTDDAVVVLTIASRSVAAAYVRAGEAFEIPGIPDGSFNVAFAAGSSWDGLSFHSNVQYTRFLQPLSFESDAYTYTTWEITLHPVPFGTGRTSHIPAAQFPGLSPDDAPDVP